MSSKKPKTVINSSFRHFWLWEIRGSGKTGNFLIDNASRSKHLTFDALIEEIQLEVDKNLSLTVQNVPNFCNSWKFWCCNYTMRGMHPIVVIWSNSIESRNIISESLAKKIKAVDIVKNEFEWREKSKINGLLDVMAYQDSEAKKILMALQDNFLEDRTGYELWSEDLRRGFSETNEFHFRDRSETLRFVLVTSTNQNTRVPHWVINFSIADFSTSKKAAKLELDGGKFSI